MLLVKACRFGISPTVVNVFKQPVSSKPLLAQIQLTRLFANDARNSFTRSARKRITLVEEISKPAGETAFTIGRGAVAGGAALGIGALCFYGLGLSSQTGAIDHASLWPEYVKERVKSTYMYFGASIVSTGLTVAACLRSPAVVNLLGRGGFIPLAVTFAAMIGSSILVQSIPYKEGFGAKQLAWLTHTGVIGGVITPMILMGGPMVLRAAWYTAGVVGGLSAVAVCAPSEKFLNMGGPLAIGGGLVFASCIGTFFLPPTTAMGASLHSIALYGGLVLFSMFLLYDTQKIIKRAETSPHYLGNSVQSFDPINNSLSIYMDTINIFIRILSIFMGGGTNRRK